MYVQGESPKTVAAFSVRLLNSPIRVEGGANGVAAINCPDCQNTVSDAADKCPHCSRPWPVLNTEELKLKAKSDEDNAGNMIFGAFWLAHALVVFLTLGPSWGFSALIFGPFMWLFYAAWPK